MKNLGAIFFTAFMLLGMALMHSAYAFNYVEGKHYLRLSKEVEENNLVKALMQKFPEKVLVLEFFSYGCDWCYTLEPYLEKWQKYLPEYVEFERIPVEFHPTWASLTKVYYTELSLNILDKIHTPFFDAIHHQKINNGSEEAMRQFFASFGISAQDFDKAYDSAEVANKQEWAKSIAQAYRITSVPVIVVQGPKGIFLTAVKYAGSETELIKVIDYLIKMQRECTAATNTKETTAKQQVENKQ